MRTTKSMLNNQFKMGFGVNSDKNVPCPCFLFCGSELKHGYRVCLLVMTHVRWANLDLEWEPNWVAGKLGEKCAHFVFGKDRAPCLILQPIIEVGSCDPTIGILVPIYWQLRI